jgi:hypothetical protein
VVEPAPQSYQYRLCQTESLHKGLNRYSLTRFVAQMTLLMGDYRAPTAATHGQSLSRAKAREQMVKRIKMLRDGSADK